MMKPAKKSLHLGVRVAMAKDRDGNVVEFVERRLDYFFSQLILNGRSIKGHI